MGNVYYHINDISEIKDNFNVGDIIYSNNNNICKSLNINKINTLIITFDGIFNTFNKKPNNNILIKVNDKTYNNFVTLLKKIKYDTNINIETTNYLYTKDRNYFLISRMPGYNKNDELKIFTKFYDNINDNYKTININEINNRFESTISIKIKGIIYNEYKDKLNKFLSTDIIEISINKYMIDNVEDNQPIAKRYNKNV
jgi:hypothetical protein